MITALTGGRNLSVGESVTLVCRVDASPDPDITWRRPDYDFGRTEHSKHLAQVRRNRPGVTTIEKNSMEMFRKYYGGDQDRGKVQKGMGKDTVVIRLKLLSSTRGYFST